MRASSPPRWSRDGRCCSSPRARSRRRRDCVRSGWARSRRRWSPASPSCRPPCVVGARSAAPGRPCRGRGRSPSGSVIPSRPKARAGARWWRCGTAWPRRSPRIARSRASTWWRAARCGNEAMTSLLGLADIERAQRALAPYLPPTPLRRAFSVPGGQAWLKLEGWQAAGSFKVRGALSVLSSLTPAERGRGVVAASAGNHALGVAFAIQALGGDVPATVFVPATAPRAKVDKLRTFPITVVEGGATYDEPAARPTEHADRPAAFTVQAYDDPATAAGQGTVAPRSLEQIPRIGTTVVPVGGGGLIAGIAAAVKAQRPPP